MPSLRTLLLITAGLLTALPTTAIAGGGPENVLLVVNRDSPASMTIANRYIQLRRIPPGNVLTLSWDRKADTINVIRFRQEILKPVLATISRRKLEKQIDYVIYSSDFPWGIALGNDIKKMLADARKARPDFVWPERHTPMGSINGLTFLSQAVLYGNPSYFHDDSNYYARRKTSEQEKEPTLAFRATQQFGPKGERVESGGRRYFLSTMLGVTVERGNTVDEVLSYLGRSSLADGTHPRGTIYYMQNSDIRSKARHGIFPAAVRALKQLGVEAEILQGELPLGKDDVQGLMTGTKTFNWKSSRSSILPGAICEHFTSHGGRLSVPTGQTSLSEFLRYGAAGASGTVTEPYALAYKFPDAMIQVHYARGCTLAEAFYQSVAGPYQLLIVGDPLCRPWANIPRVSVKGLEASATVKGKLSLRPSATIKGKSKVDHFQLFIDGLRTTECGVGESLDFDTRLLGDGYHELRVVAFEAGLIRSQGRWIAPITTANHGRTITVEATPAQIAYSGKPLTLTVKSPGSSGIVLLHNSRLLGAIKGSAGRLRIDEPAALGYGTVQLRVVGFSSAKPTSYVWAKPINLTIKKAGQR